MAAQASSSTQAGLKGHYGFLTDYRPMSQEEINKRVDQMFAMGIREIQFYDWFYSYSVPIPRDRSEMWKDPFFKTRDVSLVTIRAFIQAIKARNGRAWAYVQMVGASEDFLERLFPNVSKLIQGNGQEYVHKEGVLHCYFPDRAWAERMVKVWARPIQELGFDGIHWDTLGQKAGNPNDESAAMHEFLKYSYVKLQEMGLRQTANFVDLHWWHDPILREYVEFPYAEVWHEKTKDAYYSKIKELFSKNSPKGELWGVIAFYPQAAGRNCASLFIEALSHRCSYLFLGDGEKRLVNEYFPGAIDMIEEEKYTICWHIFKLRVRSGTKIALRTDQGYFFSADKGGGNLVKASVKHNELYEKFTVIICDEDKRLISLRTHDDEHYLSAEDGGALKAEVNAKYSKVEVWQKFKVCFYNHQQIALRTSKRTFVSADVQGGGALRTEAKMLDWERLTYITG